MAEVDDRLRLLRMDLRTTLTRRGTGLEVLSFTWLAGILLNCRFDCSGISMVVLAEKETTPVDTNLAVGIAARRCHFDSSQNTRNDNHASRNAQ